MIAKDVVIFLHKLNVLIWLTDGTAAYPVCLAVLNVLGYLQGVVCVLYCHILIENYKGTTVLSSDAPALTRIPHK